MAPRCHLEADDVGPKLLDSLHREMWFQPVKHCHSAAVSARRICRNDAIPNRPKGVYFVCYLCLLEDAQVHVGLVNPPQRQLQSPVTAVTDVVYAEPNRYLPPSQDSQYSDTSSINGRLFDSGPCCPPCLSLPTLSTFLVPFRPPWPSLAVPVSVTVPILPPFLFRAVHLYMG